MNKEYWHRKWQFKEIGFNQLQPNKLMQQYFFFFKTGSWQFYFYSLVWPKS